MLWHREAEGLRAGVAVGVALVWSFLLDDIRTVVNISALLYYILSPPFDFPFLLDLVEKLTVLNQYMMQVSSFFFSLSLSFSLFPLSPNYLIIQGWPHSIGGSRIGIHFNLDQVYY